MTMNIHIIHYNADSEGVDTAKVGENKATRISEHDAVWKKCAIFYCAHFFELSVKKSTKCAQ